MTALGRLVARLAVLAAGALLAACGGGGGGGGSASVAPTPTPVLTIGASPAALEVGQVISLSWSAQNTGATSCTASGAWSGQQATSGTVTLPATAPSAGFGSASSASTTFTLTCGASSASASVLIKEPLARNAVALNVDGGPAGAGNQINLPYVSVTVCQPGTTTCATIDHVLVDTGSYGLRLLAPAALALGLPAVTAPSGAAAGECAQFIGGYTWGAVVAADLILGGESAAALPIQLIGATPGGVSDTPAACSSVGNNIGSVAALGANGILGVGLLRHDCGAACVASAISAAYYSCAGATCVPSRMPLVSQVSNPVASFAVNNNGVMLRLPDVAAGGAASIEGRLLFGVNTAANNAITGETTLRANSSGNFSTIYKGTTLSASFIDSGSNGIFFNDASLAACTVSTGFYCPTAQLLLSATTVAADGSASRVVDFSIENVETLGTAIHAARVGGASGTARTGGNKVFDWGLPFFFGRKVFVGMENGTVRGYWAY